MHEQRHVVVPLPRSGIADGQALVVRPPPGVLRTRCKLGCGSLCYVPLAGGTQLAECSRMSEALQRPTPDKTLLVVSSSTETRDGLHAYFSEAGLLVVTRRTLNLVAD